MVNLVEVMLMTGEPTIQYQVVAVTEEHGEDNKIILGSFVSDNHRNALAIATTMLFLDSDRNDKVHNVVLESLDTWYNLDHLSLLMYPENDMHVEKDNSSLEVFRWECQGITYLTPEYVDFDPFEFQIEATEKNLIAWIEVGYASQFLDIMEHNCPAIEIDYVEGLKKDEMQFYHLLLPDGTKPTYTLIKTLETFLDRGY